MSKYSVIKSDGTILGETEIDGTVKSIEMRNVNSTATIHIEPSTGYNWQGDFVVTGADASASPLEGVLYLSNPVGNVSVEIIYKKNVYSITTNATHCTVTGSASIEFEGSVSLRVLPDTGYVFPDTVSVTGASFTYDKYTGFIVINNPTDNVTITATAKPISYSIINNLTNCISRSGNPDTINRDSSVTMNYDLSAGYVFPNSISVENASYTWDSNGGLVLSNPTDNVSVTIVCPAMNYTINYSTVNCDWDGAQNISVEAVAVATLTPHVGYKLPDSITVTNCTYTYDKSNGTVQMSNPTGNVTISCTAVKITYSITTNVTYGSYTGATTIEYGGVASVTITADSGYVLPDSITVTGATETWNKDTGTIYLSSPTKNVVITCVCVEEQSTGETWLLYEQVDATSMTTTEINFTSNNTQYTFLQFRKGYIGYSTEFTWSDEYMVYDTVSWINEVYRTITFETAPTGTLLTWLQENGTKQGGTTRISFTIDGKEFYAIQGMTWEEFVSNGDFNPGEFFTYNNTIVTSDYSTVQYNGVNVTPTDIIQANTNYTLASPATLISFTIGGTSYQAESGMTWAQWVDSSYNTGSFMNVGTWIGNQNGQSVVIMNGKIKKNVKPSDTIQESTAYFLDAGSGGGN